ncbi:MAG: ATP-binding protein [Terracidiphilus sp.]|jgi:anti-sigma regulatory factor (Ser/Thr protein kinase)
MPAENTVQPEPRLSLQSELDELARLWPWVEALAAEYAVPADTRFAIHLCLEEALSNVVRHGYGGQPNHSITVECAPAGTHQLVFTIEDQAPPFDPLASSAAEETPAPSSIDQLRPGGQGIRLLRKFAGSLAYERLTGGNRLTIGFVFPR